MTTRERKNNSERETKFCSHCGAKISKEAEICPKCGVRVKEQPINIEVKSAGISAVLSYVYPGLGQIYNGQIGKGIIFLIIGVILILTMFLLIGFILYPLFWVYNIYDAYNTAKMINEHKLKI